MGPGRPVSRRQGLPERGRKRGRRSRRHLDCDFVQEVDAAQAARGTRERAVAGGRSSGPRSGSESAQKLGAARGAGSDLQAGTALRRGWPCCGRQIAVTCGAAGASPFFAALATMSQRTRPIRKRCRAFNKAALRQRLVSTPHPGLGHATFSANAQVIQESSEPVTPLVQPVACHAPQARTE